jgi:hypothetical protein
MEKEIEHFNIVSKNKLSITFQSSDTGVIINLNKKWIKERFNGNVERIIAMDNTDNGELVFYTLDDKGVI